MKTTAKFTEIDSDEKQENNEGLTETTSEIAKEKLDEFQLYNFFSDIADVKKINNTPMIYDDIKGLYIPIKNKKNSGIFRYYASAKRKY